MPKFNPAPQTASEKTAAYRARQRAAKAIAETLQFGEKAYVLKDTDIPLIHNMLKHRIEMSANADAKAEYRDLADRLERQARN